MQGQKLPVVNGDAETRWGHYAIVVLSVAALAFFGYLVFVAFLKDVMPAFPAYSLYFLSVVAGVATFFSPCSFPLLPGYLSLYYETDEKSEGPLRRGFVAAMGVVSFNVVLGLLIATLGQGFASSFSISSGNPSSLTLALRVGVGSVLVLLGLVQFSNTTFHSRALDTVTARLFSRNEPNVSGLYLYGLGYSTAGIGCAGPIMAGLVVFALGSGGFADAFAAFVLYSATMASLMVGISLMVAKSKTVMLGSLKHSTRRVKKASSLLMIGVGAFLVYATLNLQLLLSLFPR
ncbi:MAG: cytochrome c biogenesis protein CcdA [Thaumarchaeota archaeon]|nr:cytochrome c biogenesis protein CcdA [Nitrososphaerota archaeon]